MSCDSVQAAQTKDIVGDSVLTPECKLLTEKLILLMGKCFRGIQLCKRGTKRAAEALSTKIMKARRTEHNAALAHMTSAKPPSVSKTILDTPSPLRNSKKMKIRLNVAQKAAIAGVT